IHLVSRCRVKKKLGRRAPALARQTSCLACSFFRRDAVTCDIDRRSQRRGSSSIECRVSRSSSSSARRRLRRISKANLAEQQQQQQPRTTTRYNSSSADVSSHSNVPQPQKEKFDPNLTDDKPGDAGEIERRLLARLNSQDELIATLQAQLLSLSDTKSIAVSIQGTQGPVTSTASSPTYTSSALTSANPPISQSTPIFTSATGHTNTFVSPAQNFSNSPNTGFNFKFNPLANPFAQGNPHTQLPAPQQGFVFDQRSAPHQGFVFNQPPTQHSGHPSGLYRYRQVTVPEFWFHDPRSWFELLEGEFALLGIQNDDIKYNASLRALGNVVCKQISAFLHSIRAREARFEKVKAHVIHKFSPTVHEKIDQLFQHCSLGSKKPSELLNEMQALGQGYVSDDTLTLMWYRQLPTELAILLDEQITSSNTASLVQRADRLHERLKPKGYSQISAIDCEDNNTAIDFATSVANAVIAAIGKSPQTRSRSKERNSRSESRSKSNTRYGPDRDYCWYHHRFGHDADNCSTPPCAFKQKNPIKPSKKDKKN
ncbi:unnamed protein product, partial [Trichogramma brassicae]